MKKLSAEFEIVTPMFLGGADQKATRIREASIKGALAFWWRALNYARFVSKGDRNHDQALKALQKHEQDLFGGPEGQGAFLLKASTEPDNARLNVLNQKFASGPGTIYLGYGLMNFEGKLQERDAIAPSQRFKIDILLRPNKDEVTRLRHENELIEALKILGLLGGLGSRVRRGWGSLSLLQITSQDGRIVWNGPSQKSNYENKVREVLTGRPFGETSGREFDLSAFAKESRIWVSDTWSRESRLHETKSPMNATWKNWDVCLEWLGRAFLNYRAHGEGSSRNVGGQTVQQQFIGDHDWFLNLPERVPLPYRTAFGLPHNYFKRDGDKKKLGSVNTSREGRRGSPLLFHIQKAGDGYFPVVLMLPTRFVNRKIEAKPSSGPIVSSTYDLYSSQEPLGTTGVEVLSDFVGHGPNTFKSNQVMSFREIAL